MTRASGTGHSLALPLPLLASSLAHPAMGNETTPLVTPGGPSAETTPLVTPGGPSARCMHHRHLNDDPDYEAASNGRLHVSPPPRRRLSRCAHAVLLLHASEDDIVYAESHPWIGGLVVYLIVTSIFPIAIVGALVGLFESSSVVGSIAVLLVLGGFYAMFTYFFGRLLLCHSQTFLALTRDNILIHIVCHLAIRRRANHHTMYTACYYLLTHGAMVSESQRKHHVLERHTEHLPLQPSMPCRDRGQRVLWRQGSRHVHRRNERRL